MKFEQKGSLRVLQQQIKHQLLNMPSSLHKKKSLDLRRTLGGNPQRQIINSALKKMQSFNSINLESSRKREASLTSTRIPESSKPTMCEVNAWKDKTKQKMGLKMQEKGKLQKKMSKQDSPKPFIKQKRGETFTGEYSLANLSTNYERIGLISPNTPKRRKQPLKIQQYQAIIQQQRLLIDKLQQIIVSFVDD